MSERDKPDAERPDAQNATARIWDLSDDDDIIHAVISAGENDALWFYLVVIERVYEGRTYLNERYAQLAKPHADDLEDTWKKNGINRRAEDPEMVSGSLGSIYTLIERRERAFNQGQMDVEDFTIGYLDMETGDGEIPEDFEEIEPE